MSRWFCLVLMCALNFVSASFAAAPVEWPQWRGANRDGISPDTGLLKQWPEKGPELAWESKGLGTGLSSVSVADGKIFTMGERGDESFVVCLSGKDGSEIWSTKIDSANKGQGHPGPRCTPTYDNDLVFALGGNGELACLETGTGKVRWQKSMTSDFGGKKPHWDFAESPLVDGEFLICIPGGKEAGLVALNKKTGKEVWRSALTFDGKKGKDEASYSSVVIGHGCGIKQYVTLTARGAVGVDAKTGKQLWSYNKVANGIASVPTPIIKDDYVVTASGYGDGGIATLKLSKTGTGINAEEIYYHDAKTLQNHHGGMIMVGDYVYGGHGQNKGFPFCIDWKTGKIAYVSKDREYDGGSAAIGYADGLFYFRYENGTMALMDMNPEGFKRVSQFKIPKAGGKDPSWPHPVIIGGKLYLREQDSLYCYNVKPSSSAE